MLEPDYITDDGIQLWSDVAILPQDTQKNTKEKKKKTKKEKKKKTWHNNMYTKMKFAKIDTIIRKRHLLAKMHGLVGVVDKNELPILHIEKYSGGLFY